MEIRDYHRPTDLDEAYDLIALRGGYPLGGGAWSLTTGARVESGVDLGSLGLRYIRAEGGRIAIGAMATARDLETSDLLAASFGTLFAKALGHIAGVQVRTIVSVGGSVAGRYGFSELLVLLLALDARVSLYREGETPLSAFLQSPRGKPFLLEKILVAPGASAGFQSLRAANNDFSLLSVCASSRESGWRVVVGARPQVAALGENAGAWLGLQPKPGDAAAARAGELAAQELRFGDDVRAGAAYRQAVCPVLVARAVMEASS